MLQSIPAISPLKAYTAIVPLAFVLGVGMIREAVEDFVRYKNDKVSNSQAVNVLFKPDLKQPKNGTEKKPELMGDLSFHKEQSMRLRVGDLVKISEDEIFPADLVILASSSPEGICFV